MNDRSCIDSAFEFKDITDAGAFIGMGSVFGNIDQGGDIVMPGAFSQSLQDCTSKGRMPAMLWQHRQGTPIGAWQSMTEKSPAGSP
jgi:HK97 family phage prohead protease